MAASYRDALQRLLAVPSSPKLGLGRMRALLAQLGNPHMQLTVLHVAGTKGKGSTCAFVDAICRQAGLHTGLTTSPHLCCARERIQLNGIPIDEATFVALEKRVSQAAARTPGDPATFFERMIAMSFLAFAEADVEVAIVEVGLGGRLDATNVVMPRACAVTRLGLDHMEWLGDTRASIAREKAGIFKPGVPVVTVVQEADAMGVLREEASKRGAPLTVVQLDPHLMPALRGAHQRDNASLAAALVRAARLPIGEDQIRRGVSSAFWPGRYETVDELPHTVLDGAHNDESARSLLQTLQDDRRLRGRPLHAVVGMSGGHDATSFAVALAPALTTVTATQAKSPRALPAAAVGRAWARAGRVCDEVGDVRAALELARGRAAADLGAVVVTGSLFVVGEARALFVPMPQDDAMPGF